MPLTVKITIGILVSIIATIIVYDVVIAIEPTPGDTVSKVLLRHFQAFPFSPWAMGVVFMGHISWPYHYTGNYLWYSIPVLIILAIVVFVLSWYRVLPRLDPVIYFVLGAPCGHFLWPQQ